MERNKIANDQIGGNFFYLPCDITHYTIKKYFILKKDTFPGVSDVIFLIGNPDESKLGGRGYYQDGYVQLFNGKDYINITNLEIVDSVNVNKMNYTCIANNCYIWSNFFNEIRRTINRGVTFNIGRTESIIPAGSYTQSLITKDVSPDFINDNFIEIDIPKTNPSYLSEREGNKGGNFISSPNGKIFYIEGASQKFLNNLSQKTSSEIVKIKCGFKAANTFRHIDEIMCFMPYGPGKYKVWFYDKFDINCFDQLLGDDSNYIDQKIQELNKERLQNLDIISQKLFRKPFNDCVDNFVFFKFYSFLPSIFNRTWYETQNSCVCLFPERIIEPNLSKLKKEMTNVRSMINAESDVIYNFIKVKSSNELKPEGTLHCLIKQRFVKPKHLHRLIELQCKPKEFPPRKEFPVPRKVSYPSNKFSSSFRSKYLKYKLKYLKLKKLLSEKENNIIL